MRSEFQAILDQNNIEERMKMVETHINKEVQVKLVNLTKFEAAKKRMKERGSFLGGAAQGGPDDESKTEIDDL